ncbi:hypothetical protein AVEN_37792-1 [Araneus ventricosus]|uniref:Uncharacterized protein n=1 Tax=Araneus ventricosus TaxID=182803 RepID=A0A4Y2WBG8_ARAVE|nr:hypothetical protein AVEN_37792-1 [Araneus ventricosus]
MSEADRINITDSDRLLRRIQHLTSGGQSRPLQKRGIRKEEVSIRLEQVSLCASSDTGRDLGARCLGIQRGELSVAASVAPARRGKKVHRLLLSRSTMCEWKSVGFESIFLKRNLFFG